MQEKGLGTKAGVQQDLFTARMMVYSSAAGYSNLDKHQEESAQVSKTVPRALRSCILSRNTDSCSRQRADVVYPFLAA